MFSAKQNTAKPTNNALINTQSKPFFSPKMKVVKSENTEEIKSKVQEKSSVIKPEKTPFIAPKKTEVLDKEKLEVADTKPEALETSKTQSKNGETPKPLQIVSDTVKPATKVVSTPQVKQQVTKETKKIKEETTNSKEKVEEVLAKEEAILKSPAKPEDDPAFQAQIAATEKVKEEKSKHPNPKTKVEEQQAAGHASPTAQANKNDQQAHAASMDATSEQEREPFTPESFKKLLETNLKDLESNLPTDAEGAKKFKKEKPIKDIKENISGQVTSESNKLAGPMKSEADKPAPTTGAPTIEAQSLPVANAGLVPKPLNAKAAIPKPKTSQEISMEKESQSLDVKMTENNVTDEQLAKSNEPKFTGALDQKNQAQVEAKLAPINYRKKEGAQLGAAQNDAKTTSQDSLAQMQGAKQVSENNVLTNQTTNKTSDKTEQEKIFAEFEAIYEETKNTVTNNLEKLSEDVDKKFSEEAESAQITFEKNVEDGLDNIYGWTVIDDWIFGEDTDAINKLFIAEKSKFVATMNTVLDAISIIIADGLNAALDAIADGKKKSKEKFDGLDASQKKLGEEAFNDFNDQYAELEDTVYAQQEELASSLAQSYKENVDSLQEKFDEIKESVSAGWIGGALNALTGVIETIKKLRDLIANLLAETQNAMGVIMEDPIGFVGTLFEGVGKGIDMFMANIQKHMLGGFVTWLTGAMGPVGITIPDNLFSLQGIFSLVMQVLGLSWDFMRKKSVQLLGEPMVNAMEKGFEMFQTIKEKGVAGMWEHMKEQFTDLKETIMDSIKNMLITQVIEAGIKWLVSLLIPGAGFIKAIMAIKDLIVFFVESAVMLIPSLIKAIKSLASGNVSGVSKAIEKGLASLLPLVIGLFAKLIGLGGLVKKVQKIIKKVRKRIDRAVTKLIKKAKKKFKSLVKKGKAKVKGAVKRILNWLGVKKQYKDKNNKKHTLYLKGNKKNAKLYRASLPLHFKEYIDKVENQIKGDKALETKHESDIIKAKRLDEEISKLLYSYSNTDEKWRPSGLNKGKKGQKSEGEQLQVKMDELVPVLKNLPDVGEDNKIYFPKSEITYSNTPEITEPTQNMIDEEHNKSGKKNEGKKVTATTLSMQSSESGGRPSYFSNLYNYLNKNHQVIAGHLLYHRLHGKGTDGDNLAPISNTDNRKMNSRFESKAFDKVFNKKAVLYYEVEMKYGSKNEKDILSYTPEKISAKVYEKEFVGDKSNKADLEDQNKYLQKDSYGKIYDNEWNTTKPKESNNSEAELDEQILEYLGDFIDPNLVEIEENGDTYIKTTMKNVTVIANGISKGVNPVRPVIREMLKPGGNLYKKKSKGPNSQFYIKK